MESGGLTEILRCGNRAPKTLVVADEIRHIASILELARLAVELTTWVQGFRELNGVRPQVVEKGHGR